MSGRKRSRGEDATTLASSSRAYCFERVGSWTQEQVAAVEAWKCQYLVFGETRGVVSGLRGFVYFLYEKTPSAAAKLGVATFGDEETRWEAVSGATADSERRHASERALLFEKGNKPLTSAQKGQAEIAAWRGAVESARAGAWDAIRPDIVARCRRRLQAAVGAPSSLPSAAVVDLPPPPPPHEWHFGALGCGKTAHAVYGQEGAVFVHNEAVEQSDARWAAYAGEPTVAFYPPPVGVPRPRWAQRLLGAEPFEVRDAVTGAVVRRIRPPRVLVVARHHPQRQISDGAEYREVLRLLGGGVFHWSRPLFLVDAASGRFVRDGSGKLLRGNPTMARVECGDEEEDEMSDLTEEEAATTTASSSGARRKSAAAAAAGGGGGRAPLVIVAAARPWPTTRRNP